MPWNDELSDGIELVDATLPLTRFESCDLSRVQLSKATLAGSRLRHCTLDGLQGADALRGVTITSDSVLPAALALFGALGVVLDDGESDGAPTRPR